VFVVLRAGRGRGKEDLISLLYGLGYLRTKIVLLLRHIHLFNDVALNKLIEKLQVVLRRVLILSSGLDKLALDNVNQLSLVLAVCEGAAQFLLEGNFGACCRVQ
jgi:hypothetical protein